jgi:hypothetical protein
MADAGGRWISLVLSLALAACGGSDEAAPPGVTAHYGDPATTVLSPYPSNRYTQPADTPTGLALALPQGSPDLLFTPGLETTVGELAAMDGFSTTGGVIVTFDGPIEQRGIAPGPADDPSFPPPADARSFMVPESPLMLLDVDPDSPERGRAVGLVCRYWEQPKNEDYVRDEFTLIAAPAVPLRPATRYLFVVTDSLKARSGGPVLRTPQSDELLGGRAIGPYADEVGQALGELETSLGVSRERLALATVFTTASVLDGVKGLSRRARKTPAPALLEPWTVETEPGPDGRVELRAVFEAPEYRTPPPDARWEFDAAGEPVLQDEVGLEVFMAVSNATSSEPRPVVIYGHGLGGDKGGAWGTAERLRDLNAAVFAIDAPHHGSRNEAGEQGAEITAIANFFGLDLAASTFVIGRARDNFRQMASDQLELVKLIGSLGDLDVLPPGAPDGIPDLDVSCILYIGHSFGAVQGPTIFALAPEIRHAVWNVGGAGLMMLLRDSNTFSLVIVNALRPPGESDGAVARFMAITQAVVDPGDPLNFARYGALEPLGDVPDWTPRDVLLQEVIADTIVPNSTSRALARAAGMVLIDAIDPVSGLDAVASPVVGNLATGATAVMSQFDIINGDVMATHGELIFSPEGRAQYLEFFQTGLSDGRSRVPAGY